MPSSTLSSVLPHPVSSHPTVGNAPPRSSGDATETTPLLHRSPPPSRGSADFLASFYRQREPAPNSGMLPLSMKRGMHTLGKIALAVDGALNREPEMPAFSAHIVKSGSGELDADTTLFRNVLAYMRSRQHVESRETPIDSLSLPARFRIEISMEAEPAMAAFDLLKQRAAMASEGRLARPDRQALGDEDVQEIRAHLQVSDENAMQFANAHGIGAEAIADARSKIESTMQLRHGFNEDFAAFYRQDPVNGEEVLAVGTRQGMLSEADVSEIRAALTISDEEIVKSIATSKVQEKYGLSKDDCELIAGNPAITDTDIRWLAGTRDEKLGGDIMPTMLELLQHRPLNGLGADDENEKIYAAMRGNKVKVRPHLEGLSGEERVAVTTFCNRLRTALDNDHGLRSVLGAISAEKLYQHRETSLISLGGGLGVSVGLDTLWEKQATPWFINLLRIPKVPDHPSSDEVAAMVAINSVVNGILEIPDSIFGLMGLGGESDGHMRTAVMAGIVSALGASVANTLEYVAPKAGVAGGALAVGKLFADLLQAFTSISAYPIKMRELRMAQVAAHVAAMEKNVIPAASVKQVNAWVKATVSSHPEQQVGHAVIALTALSAVMIYAASPLMTAEQHRETKTSTLGPAESNFSFLLNLAALYGLPILNMLLSAVNTVARTSLRATDMTERKFERAFHAASQSGPDGSYLSAKENRQLNRSMLAKSGYGIVAVMAYIAGGLLLPARQMGWLNESVEERIVSKALEPVQDRT